MDPDDESIVKVNSESYTIVDSDWWSFLVEHNINRTVDVAREVHGNAPR